MLSDFNFLTLLPISISLISLIISWLAYRQNKRVRIEDTKGKLYEKLLDTALLAESNVQLLSIAENNTQKLLPDDSELFKERYVEAERFKQKTRDLIEQVRSIKMSNRNKDQVAILHKYYQAGELYVSVKALNDIIVHTNRTLEVYLDKKRA